MSEADGTLAASFRDPSGFVFTRDGEVLRQVNHCYADDYDLLMSSGLYDDLTAAGLLIPHEELSSEHAPRPEQAHRVLRPRQVGFVSHPCEWSFTQLKDAALTTLEVQKRAFAHGMSLKDASAYNIQFVEGRATLIDTLSFERYREGEPWVAYRQMCRHFLAPLTLMHYTDVRLSQLLRVHLDGVPLDLASRLLPRRTWLRLSLLLHVHLHARSEKRYEGATDVSDKTRGKRVSRLAFAGIVDSIKGAIRRLRWRPQGTEWAAYYEDTNYSDDALDEKGRLVDEFVGATDAHTVWDLGANTGRFSRVAARHAGHVVAFDIDPAAVERNVLDCKRDGVTNVLPLVLDLTNPTPGMGWENAERAGLFERGPADAVLALALVHHLAIGNNLPFERIAQALARLCTWLVIEFVPKSDSQIRRLLVVREDIFDNYTREVFERTFARFFTIERTEPIGGSERILYLMKRR
jgi:ribosomal protein L11 methylase PrmA